MGYGFLFGYPLKIALLGPIKFPVIPWLGPIKFPVKPWLGPKNIGLLCGPGKLGSPMMWGLPTGLPVLKYGFETCGYGARYKPKLGPCAGGMRYKPEGCISRNSEYGTGRTGYVDSLGRSINFEIISLSNYLIISSCSSHSTAARRFSVSCSTILSSDCNSSVVVFKSI